MRATAAAALVAAAGRDKQRNSERRSAGAGRAEENVAPGDVASIWTWSSTLSRLVGLLLRTDRQPGVLQAAATLGALSINLRLCSSENHRTSR